jgi:hypothetical protein
MENKRFFRIFLPILFVFILSNGFFITSRSLVSKWNIDHDLVIIGNLVLFLATAVSFFLYYKALYNNNVQGFLRLIYGGMFLKMMICLFTAFFYILIAGKAVNKGGIIVCLALYLLYSVVEIVLIMKHTKQRRNA